MHHDDTNECIVIGRYTLTYYKKNSPNLIVVFCSAGARLAGPIEEFKNSLSEYNISMLFVRDQHASWFGEPEALDMFKAAATIAETYTKVAVLGESMGGSGALIFPRFCDNIDRTLAFSPLYSFAYPFNQFAKGWANDKEPLFWSFNCDKQPIKLHTVILYGLRQWQDIPHAGMYALEHYPVFLIKRSSHLVASYLKKGGNRNYLSEILDSFLNFNASFTKETLLPIIQPLIGHYGCDDVAWTYEADRVRSLCRVSSAILLPIPNGKYDIAQGCETTQSSVWAGAYGKTPEEDSRRAISKDIPEFFAFHTGLEDYPWWMVTLKPNALIDEIRIYNRIDSESERSIRFKIEIFKNSGWELLFEKDNYDIFGGIDGKPFLLKLETPIAAEKIKIQSLEKENYLHYQKIEVIGNYI